MLALAGVLDFVYLDLEQNFDGNSICSRLSCISVHVVYIPDVPVSWWMILLRLLSIINNVAMLPVILIRLLYEALQWAVYFNVTL